MKQTYGQRIADILARHSDIFLIDLAEWLSFPEHWLIWGALEYHANTEWEKQKGAVRPRYSARTIGQNLRSHTDLAQKCGKYKIDDHLWPECARLYMLIHPERDGFFELRGRKAA